MGSEKTESRSPSLEPLPMFQFWSFSSTLRSRSLACSSSRRSFKADLRRRLEERVLDLDLCAPIGGYPN